MAVSRRRRPGRRRSLVAGWHQGAASLVLVSALFVAALLQGSTHQPYSGLSQVLLACAVLSSLAGARIRGPAQGLATRMLAAHACLAAWILAQIVPVADWLAHPAWLALADAGIPAQGRISANLEETREALPRAMMPLMAFLSALLLAADDRAATRLWHALALAGFGLVLLAVSLELWFPETRVFSDRPVGEGTLSGFIVNRNVAGALFVFAAFALLGSVLLAQRTPRDRAASPEARLLGWALPALALFLVIVAVIATQSRAAALFGLPILLASGGLAWAVSGERARRASGEQARRGRAGVIGLAALGGAAATFALFALFGEPVLARLEGTDERVRLCAWQAARALIAERPLLGHGLGTFADVFPAERDPVCFGTEGRLVRAHNAWLELIVGLGLPGALFLAYLGLEATRILATGLKHRRRMRVVPVLLAGLTLYIALHSWVDFPAQYPGVAAYAAALWGVGAALCLCEPERPRRSRPPSGPGSGPATGPGQRAGEQGGGGPSRDGSRAGGHEREADRQVRQRDGQRAGKRDAGRALRGK